MEMLTPAEFRALMESTHMDAEGLISPDTHPGPRTSGNGVLDTSIYYIILYLTGEHRPEDRIAFERTITNLWSEGRAGLLSRNRGRPDQDAWDNYLGAAVGGLLLDALYIPRAMREYGESHCWTFQNEPGLKNLISGTLFRFPGLVATIKLSCADARPPCNVELAGLGYRLGDPADSPGAARTKWLMALAVFYSFGPTQHRSLRERAAFQLRCINNRWGSLREMLAAYHGPTSPFARIDVTTPEWLIKGRL